MTIGNQTDSFNAADTYGHDNSSSQNAQEQARHAAGTAAEETQHVAAVATQEVQRVAAEAKSQVQQLLADATTQVEEHSRTQRDRVVGSLRTLTDDLEHMAGDSSGGLAAELVQQVADRARSLTAGLEGREPRDLLDDVRRYARRKPGTFLLGALAAGVVAGRLTRGATDSQSSSPAVGVPNRMDSTYGPPPTFGADPLTDPLRAP